MRIGVLVVGICLSLVGMATSGRASEDGRQPTNIAAQELASALQLLAKERGVQVVYRSELAADQWTSGVSGNLTFEEALVQLLEATGLTYRFLADKAITIVPGSDHSSPVGSTAGRGTERSR
jgi:iron complex outermembrane recepter protein